MSYSLFWRSPALPYTQKQTAIVVPSGSVVSNAAPIRFTGKGAANYGKIQQENQMRLVENFAGPTPPDYPTVGMTWYDTAGSVLKVCVATAPQTVQWRAMNSTQITDVGEGPPTPAVLGDSWFSRTGSASGVLYTYTGLGRYPAVNWDASASGYFPLSSPMQLAADLNTAGFGNQGSNYNEAYIHGFSNGAPADVDGSIILYGNSIAVPRGAMYTSSPVTNGYIVWDTTGAMSSTAGSSVFFVVRELGDGRWQYDNNSYWTDFNVTSGMRVIGLASVASQDGNVPPGITAATMWAEAIELSRMTMVPQTLPGGAIGGWNQVWPQVEVGAGRAEYEYVYGLVASLIGDALSFGGSDALGRSIQDLTDFRPLDASLQQKWLSLMPNDQNVVRSSAHPEGYILGQFKVEPNSQDWDKLLAAAKYAVNRLELPASLVGDVSPLPFVSDGRPAPAALYSLPTTDIRFPSLERQLSRRPGIVTTMRQYQETVNVLQSAITNRYMLKGIMGTNGVNTTFNPGVSVIGQASFQDTAGFPASVVTHGLLYRFDFTNPDMQRFFFAGQALELFAVFTPSGGQAVNTDLRNLINSSGRIRLTADNAYVMTNNALPSLSVAPIGQGYKTLSANTTLGTYTVGSATITYRAGVVGGGVVVYIDILAPGAAGTFATQWNYISDNESFNAPGPTRVYPAPLAFDPSDKQGSNQFT